MIDYISGKISSLTPTEVVIDNNGIGYSIEISLQTYAGLDGKDTATIFVQKQINSRDGSEVDYGFATTDERQLFRLITGVSGIGASSARIILSSLSSDEFRDAVLSENINTLKSIKGIGLKSAQRLILELKDKIVKGDGTAAEVIFKADNSVIEEATSALQILGFPKPNIAKAIQSVLKDNPGAKVEEVIKLSLKIL